MMAETIIPIGQDKLCLTVSIGVATLGEGGATLEDLIDQADRAMYMAKDAGRNQVCFIR
jgi:diguanylate cyclase (GGDEF)-like protein